MTSDRNQHSMFQPTFGNRPEQYKNAQGHGQARRRDFNCSLFFG